MNARTQNKLSWWKPVLLASGITVTGGLFAFVYNSTISSSSNKAVEAVWKNNINNDIEILKINDTIHAKETKSIEYVIKEFIQEVRTDRTKDIMIDNLQSSQILKIADKVELRKEMDDMQKNLDNLQEQIDRQTYKIYNNNNRNMLIPEAFDSTFGQSYIKSVPCKTN